ncbi:putative patatin-like phospholipase domain, Acyl transferase/acyl hydrolase/lysophospholipase [Helianthus annuus]|nr:putative patatin-like phospholipase domain, Acyl transferase/acyl hydrolase/lysophospholipase [Helianthus annuus]
MNDQRGKVCVLSIDGGGMRCILAGKALAHLENALKEKSGDPDARIVNYIDVAAGTGVGGVFTAMLFGSENKTVPIFKAEDTWRFLVKEGKRWYNGGGGGLLTRIFRGRGGGGGGLRHATVAFEKSMKEAFVVNGRSLTLKDTLKPVLIPCYDLASSGPFVFSRVDALETDRFDFRLWEICRATSAEPEVFKPVLIKSVDGKTRCIAVDGGLAMCNPTAAAITHVLHNKHEFPHTRGVEDLLVLSLGSFQPLEGKLDYEQVKRWKARGWTRPMARISGDCLGDMVDDAVAMSFGQNRCSNYVRIQVYSNKGPNVDADPSVSNLIEIADEMLKQKNVESVMFGGKKIGDHTNFEKLEWFAGELVSEHRRRSGRFVPTIAFKQTTT